MAVFQSAGDGDGSIACHNAADSYRAYKLNRLARQIAVHGDISVPFDIADYEISDTGHVSVTAVDGAAGASRNGNATVYNQCLKRYPGCDDRGAF